jgi:hypothetical protein
MMSGQKIDLLGNYLGAFLVFAFICLPAITLKVNTPSVFFKSLPIITAFLMNPF